MNILTRGLQMLSKTGHIDFTAQRCCQAIHWAFTIRLGHRPGGS